MTYLEIRPLIFKVNKNKNPNKFKTNQVPKLSLIKMGLKNG